MAKGRKTYLNGGAKEVVFEDGNSLMNCYIDLKHAQDEGFIKQTKSGKDIIVFTIERRRETSEWGDTHSFFRKDQEVAPAKQMASKPKTYSAKPKTESEDDDLPF